MFRDHRCGHLLYECLTKFSGQSWFSGPYVLESSGLCNVLMSLLRITCESVLITWCALQSLLSIWFLHFPFMKVFFRNGPGRKAVQVIPVVLSWNRIFADKLMLFWLWLSVCCHITEFIWGELCSAITAGGSRQAVGWKWINQLYEDANPKTRWHHVK